MSDPKWLTAERHAHLASLFNAEERRQRIVTKIILNPQKYDDVPEGELWGAKIIKDKNVTDVAIESRQG